MPKVNTEIFLVNNFQTAVCSGNYLVFVYKNVLLIVFKKLYMYIALHLQFPKNYSPNPHNYPFAALINTPFVLDNGNYFLTAYFVNPGKV